MSLIAEHEAVNPTASNPIIKLKGGVYPNMKLTNLLLVGYFTLALCYLSWHLGRYYEYGDARQVINQAYARSFDCEYIIPEDDEQYGGELAQGRCFPPAVELPIIQYFFR